MIRRIVHGITYLVAICILVISMGGKGFAASLPDIPEKYSSEINYLMDLQVVTGYPDGTFRPDYQVTREEAATMIGRALKLDGTPRSTSFSDVKADSYASGYIQSAVEKNIITGYADGTFKPQEKITRGEMAYLLNRAFQLTKTSNVFFSDVPKSGSLYKAINTIVTNGLANGYTDGSFRPNNPITRVEFCLLVARGLNPDFKVSQAELIPNGERIVTTTSLNVRLGPGTEFSTVGTLSFGTKVTYYYKNGDWAYISYGSLKGFVHSAYLATPLPKGTKRIALDPGHGGSDTGAIGNGIYEKELNLSVALKVKKRLEAKGIQVVMTRSTDTFIELDERPNIAVRNLADTFLSIHANSSTTSSASGTETYYYAAALSTREECSKQLATFVQNRLYQALGTSNRGVKTAGFRVIKSNPLPAALVELGFISNASDAKKLATDTYRNKAADAITLGIIDYYNWKAAKGL
jgi:N-acetylmuramoyl-L-alanine amidase